MAGIPEQLPYSPEQPLTYQYIDQRVDTAEIELGTPLPSIKVVIMGKGPFADETVKTLMAQGQEVVGVFGPAVNPGQELDPVRATARENGIPDYKFSALQDKETLEKLIALKPDLLIGANLTAFIEKGVTEIAPMGMIGFHPGSKNYRGVSAIPWQIIDGQEEIGMICYGIGREDELLEPDGSEASPFQKPPKGSLENDPNDTADKGPVFAFRSIKLNPDARTSSTSYSKQIKDEGVVFLTDTVARLATAYNKGIIYRGEKQTRGEGFYQPPLAKKHVQIDWGESAIEVDALIRGSQFNPGAWTTTDGSNMHTLYDSTPIPGPTREPGRVLPGDDNVLTETSQGLIEARTMRSGKMVSLTKEEKGKPMAASEYAIQNGISDSTVFLSPNEALR